VDQFRCYFRNGGDSTATGRRRLYLSSPANLNRMSSIHPAWCQTKRCSLFRCTVDRKVAPVPVRCYSSLKVLREGDRGFAGTLRCQRQDDCLAGFDCAKLPLVARATGDRGLRRAWQQQELRPEAIFLIATHNPLNSAITNAKRANDFAPSE
jgi:hypothetical protein